MQKPMFASLLALCSAVAFSANANAGESHGTYFIKSGDAALMSAPVVRTESAVIAPMETTVVTPSTTLVAEPVLQQTLIMPAVITLPTGFTMDPAALRLYTGPRLENTLTMPDANTFLRP